MPVVPASGPRDHDVHDHGTHEHAAGGLDPEQTSLDLQERLRAKGQRLTPQRELVLAEVQRLGHTTPDAILAAVRLRSQAVNLSTVYRTLELLEDLGLVRHAHLTDRAPTYHSTTSPIHAHLVCRGCGKVSELATADLAAFIETLHAAHGFTPDLGHLTVFGHCAACPAGT